VAACCWHFVLPLHAIIAATTAAVAGIVRKHAVTTFPDGGPVLKYSLRLAYTVQVHIRCACASICTYTHGTGTTRPQDIFTTRSTLLQHCLAANTVCSHSHGSSSRLQAACACSESRITYPYHRQSKYRTIQLHSITTATSRHPQCRAQSALYHSLNMHATTLVRTGITHDISDSLQTDIIHPDATSGPLLWGLRVG
jgi:hypothetical protein